MDETARGLTVASGVATRRNAAERLPASTIANSSDRTAGVDPYRALNLRAGNGSACPKADFGKLTGLICEAIGEVASLARIATEEAVREGSVWLGR